MRIDPWYDALAAAGATDEELSEAGYIDAPPPTRTHDARWLATPTAKLERNAAAAVGSKLAVLVTTGAFAPPHEGHLAMMEAARAAAETAGYEVVAGWLSPSHDSYVIPKVGSGFEAQRRVSMCRDRTEPSDWLATDPWAALYQRAELNFTDVIAHIAEVVAAAGVVADVFYVFGSDNSGFAGAFVGHGHGICVARPGWRDERSSRWSSLAVKSGRVLRCAGGVPASSTVVRASGRLPEPQSPPSRSGRYVLRDDLAEMAPFVSAKTRHRFIEALEALLSEHAVAASGGVEVVRLTELPPAVADRRTISMDAIVTGDHRFELTRVFDCSDGQRQARRSDARPGRPSLSRQAAMIPAGRYVLVDDDIATGTSVAAARRWLPQCELVDVATLVGDPHPADVVDARDFLVGSTAGGLVVETADGFARAPYLAPYVDLEARACIPDQLGFSRAVWALNADVFAGTRTRLSDVDPFVAALFGRAGFDPSSRLEDVCLWHLDRIPASASQPAVAPRSAGSAVMPPATAPQDSPTRIDTYRRAPAGPCSGPLLAA